MPLNEILKLLVPALLGMPLSRLMVGRVFGPQAQGIPALQVWTACGAGACLGSFAGALLMASVPWLDRFLFGYVVGTAVAVVFGLALVRTSLHKKTRPGEGQPGQ